MLILIGVGIIMRQLSMDEYSKVVYNKVRNIEGLDNLSIAIYHWVSDFSDRKGLDHAWDEVEEKDRNQFLTKIYNQNRNNVSFDEYDMEIIESELCSFKGLGHEYDYIDSDIRQEIRETWLEIFTTNYLA
jgi:hypothetical protein